MPVLSAMYIFNHYNTTYQYTAHLFSPGNTGTYTDCTPTLFEQMFIVVQNYMGYIKEHFKSPHAENIYF